MLYEVRKRNMQCLHG